METVQNRELHCLVTGATGYIGRALVDALIGSGTTVMGVSRRPRSAGANPDADYRCADLARTDADLRGVLELDRIDQVFHLAGVAHQNSDPEEYARSNVLATERLAEASAAAGVRRFVFLSSSKAAAYRASAVRESCPGQPAELTYGLSKALAEQRLQEICGRTQMELVLLRPALVYSLDAPGNLAWLRKWAEARMPAPPPGGGRSMIARNDLVRLCIVISKLSTLDRALSITATDGEVYSVRRMHSALCASLGRQPLLPSPPSWCWRLAARTVDIVRGHPDGLTWDRLAGTEIVAADGLGALGYMPLYTLEKALEQGS